MKSQIHNLKHWNWKAIIVCFLTAFTFWAFHSLNADHTTNIAIPIHLDYSKDSLKIVAIVDPPKYINANVTGYGWTLLRKSLGIGMEMLNIPIDDPINITFLSSKSIRPFVDQELSDMKSINYLLEDSIFFDFDTLIQKKVFIQIDTNNISIEEGYRRTSGISIEPDSINFEGPYSVVHNFRDTITLSIEEEGIDQDFDEDLNINYSLSDLVSVDYDQVNVQFDVYLFINGLLTVPVTLINFPEDVKVTLDPENAEVDYYIREDLDINTSDSLSVSINFDDINVKDTIVAPQYFIPEKLKDVIVKPDYFRIKIEKK